MDLQQTGLPCLNLHDTLDTYLGGCNVCYMMGTKVGGQNLNQITVIYQL
jgi:hypothetical protein